MKQKPVVDDDGEEDEAEEKPKPKARSKKAPAAKKAASKKVCLRSLMTVYAHDSKLVSRRKQIVMKERTSAPKWTPSMMMRKSPTSSSLLDI